MLGQHQGLLSFSLPPQWRLQGCNTLGEDGQTIWTNQGDIPCYVTPRPVIIRENRGLRDVSCHFLGTGCSSVCLWDMDNDHLCPTSFPSFLSSFIYPSLYKLLNLFLPQPPNFLTFSLPSSHRGLGWVSEQFVELSCLGALWLNPQNKHNKQSKWFPTFLLCCTVMYE